MGYEDKVEFMEPPAPVERDMRRGTSPKWVRLLLPLKAKPNEWARISVRAHSMSAKALASQLEAGKFVGVVAGEFEATTRGSEVYARYIASTPEGER